jgi:hypothetical protein
MHMQLLEPTPNSILASSTLSARAHSCLQVYLASSAPPVRFPNVYGVDMPNRKEFVAHGLTEDQVRAQGWGQCETHVYLYVHMLPVGDCLEGPRAGAC